MNVKKILIFRIIPIIIIIICGFLLTLQTVPLIVVLNKMGLRAFDGSGGMFLIFIPSFIIIITLSVLILVKKNID